MDDLERLARELHKWPEKEISEELIYPDDLALSWNNGGWFFVDKLKRSGIDRDQWQVRRNELSGKPKEWVNAPEWAKYITQDSEEYNGRWLWHEIRPVPDPSYTGRWSRYGRIEVAGNGEVLGGWMDTLDERVMENITKDFTVTPDGNMTYHGDKPIHVGVGVIFNPGDTLVRAVGLIPPASFGKPPRMNESLVNIKSDESKSPEWIQWEGGECPVDYDLEVVVRLRSGGEETGPASDFDWSHGDCFSDGHIISYRPSYPNFLVNPMKDDGITEHELDESDDRGIAAIKTLEGIGYTDNGGQLWRPPIGKKPDWLDESKAEWVNGFPPVGTVCEGNYNNNGWFKCEIIAYHGDRVWIEELDRSALHFVLETEKYEFRPIKSDKEKAISALSAVLAERLPGVSLILPQDAEILYDANVRIQESDDGI